METNIFETAVNYYRNSQFENAKKYFRAVLDSEPKNTLALRYLGYCNIELQQYETAREALDRALSLKPTEFFAPDYARLAEACQHTGEPHRAIKYYKTAIELEDPRNAQVLSKLWNNVGDTEREIGDLNSSLTSYNAAINLDPKNPLFYYNIARVHKAMEQYPEAIGYYEKVLEIDPNHVEALYALAYLQGALKQYTETEQTLQRCESVCVQKGDEANLKYCRALQDLIEKKKILPLQLEPQRILSEEEAKIKYLFNKFAKSKKFGEPMGLKPAAEVIGPIDTELKKTEDNYIRFLLFNGSPEDTVGLSFSISLQKALLGKLAEVKPEKITTNLEPGQFSDLKFKVAVSPKTKTGSINGQVKIMSKVVNQKKKGTGFDVLRSMTDILIPFGGLMIDLLRKPFTKTDASKKFELTVP